MAICNICNLQVSNLKNHKATHTAFCVVCNKDVSNSNIARHRSSNYHQNKVNEAILCALPKCDASFFRNFNIFIHRGETQKDGTVTVIKCEPNINIDKIDELYDEIPKFSYKLIINLLRKHSGLKIQLVLKAEFAHRKNFVIEIKWVPSKNKVITSKDEIEHQVTGCISDIKSKIEEWDNNESYLQLNKVLYVDIKVRKYQPLVGSSYIETPKWISDRKATINIKNEDGYCFKYCIMFGLYQSEIPKDPQRLSHYKRLEQKCGSSINFDKIKFPFEVKDQNFKMFHRNNPSISLNIYFVENSMILPLKFCDEEKINHMNLLLIQKQEKTHFLYIKDLSKLVG